MRKLLFAAMLIPLLLFGALLAAYGRDVHTAAPFYASAGAPRDDGARQSLRPVRSVRILPLIDYYSARTDLETEPGLSYLVYADDTRVLFDLGLNASRTPQPPLLRNAKRLKVDASSVDLVVISHPHADHLNGSTDSAILQEANDPLAGKPIYSTVPLKTSSGISQVVNRPSELAAGVGTTGPVPVALFGYGLTLEQSLVLNLEGKGLVLVIGCGHPGVGTLVRRAEQVYQMPVYAVIGGLHLMAHDSRAKLGPIPIQKLVASSSPPWQLTGESDVQDAIGFLQRAGIRIVGVSAHDSDDWTLDAFAAAYGADYRPVRVGEPIEL
jgi:7,8-dihydropterin-6-yl-methyl-4-(beta-D-ribofuranosyl)aminobenzene 5'-phosphate synthase